MNYGTIKMCILSIGYNHCGKASSSLIISSYLDRNFSLSQNTFFVSHGRCAHGYIHGFGIPLYREAWINICTREYKTLYTPPCHSQYFLVSTLVGEGDLVRLFSGDLPRLSGDRDRLSLLTDLICCLCISCVARGSPM